MPEQRDEHATQGLGIGREKADDQKIRNEAGAEFDRGGLRLFGECADLLQPVGEIATGNEDRRDGAGAGADRRAPQRLRDRALEPDILGEDELPFAADAPAIAERPARDAFTHGAAAEEHALAGDEPCIGGEIDGEAPVEARAREQDALLRHPASDAPAATVSPVSIRVSAPWLR